eukprot:7270100-Heterocapsa_arctica.AAC.1
MAGIVTLLAVECQRESLRSCGLMDQRESTQSAICDAYKKYLSSRVCTCAGRPDGWRFAKRAGGATLAL